MGVGVCTSTSPNKRLHPRSPFPPTPLSYPVLSPPTSTRPHKHRHRHQPSQSNHANAQPLRTSFLGRCRSKKGARRETKELLLLLFQRGGVWFLSFDSLGRVHESPFIACPCLIIACVFSLSLFVHHPPLYSLCYCFSDVCMFVLFLSVVTCTKCVMVNSTGYCRNPRQNSSPSVLSRLLPSLLFLFTQFSSCDDRDTTCPTHREYVNFLSLLFPPLHSKSRMHVPCYLFALDSDILFPPTANECSSRQRKQKASAPRITPSRKQQVHSLPSLTFSF